MTGYQVEFSEEAVADFQSSFEWGCDNWGRETAAKWYVESRDSINRLLGAFPLSQPIAPENEEYDVEVRQMILGRYRVLFNIDASVVTVLHIRGPYPGNG